MTDIKLYCSFCGKRQDEVAKLVAGPSTFICDECIELCRDITAAEGIGPSVIPRPPGWRKGQMIFNFLEWVRIKKGRGADSRFNETRMFDPFHLQDAEWDALYAEFLNQAAPVKAGS